MSALFDAARDYMSLGFVTIPVAGKRPVVRWRCFSDGRSRPTGGDLRDWFGRDNVTGIGLVCGPASGGLTVADFDDFGAYQVWRRGFSDLANSLPTVKTKRGAHVWFRSKLTRTACRDWGELKASGIVVAPPSAHPDGGEYVWLSELPRWNLPFIEPGTVGLLGDATQERVTQENVTQELACVATPVSCVTTSPAEIERLVVATLPPAPGRRNRLVFKLAQALRPFFATPDDARPWVELWHRRALPNIGTPDFAETWRDFCYGFERVQHPRGALLSRVAATIPQDAAPLDRLRAACRALAAGSDRPSFFLSCRTAAALVGSIDHVQASRLLSTLRKAGELVRVKRGVRPLASEYRLGKLAEKISNGS